jgi:hypothetical protein
MTELRWGLIIVTAIMAVGWVLLVIWADSFRRSMRGSASGSAMLVLPLVVLSLVLASLLVPDQNWLQHAVAATAIAVVVGCLVLMAETALLATLGLIYFGLWLLHYWHTVWRAAGALE